MQVVWLKRDLRLGDHAPLWYASRLGPVVAVYVFEPSVWQSGEYDETHLRFVSESLRELQQSIATRGGRLLIRVGELPAVLAELHRRTPISGLWSHQETGTRITYDRDQRVLAWCREHSIDWQEFQQGGVVRRLKTRDGWAQRWRAVMRADCLQPPVFSEQLFDSVESHPFRRELPDDEWPSVQMLHLQQAQTEQLPRGGESAALQALSSFLTSRGRMYRRGMSSPLTAFQVCSRLSPYLSWGCVSTRRAWQDARSRLNAVRSEAASGDMTAKEWAGSIESFLSRLSWRCHFMQKLESQPEIEFVNFSRVYDGLREHEFSPVRFAAWCGGQTGYPLVDACMRALHAERWLNFRMRAMLASFAAYHLWLHWQPTAIYLARLFLDYEPGIHFSQFQMQSGTTGINTIRIYSPAKQVRDHDPRGEFIRKHVPELADVPEEYIAEPHRMPELLQRMCGCRIGRDYPAPIVDHETAYRQAQERIFEIRKSAEAQREATQVYRHHGSRQPPRRRM